MPQTPDPNFAARRAAAYRAVPYVSTAGAPVSTRASFTIPAGDPGLQRTA